MSVQCFEAGNRRAEVRPSECDLFKTRVVFQRMSGRVRRSRWGIWHVDVDDASQARQLAEDWAFRGWLVH